jgi:hypothetical protein
MTTDIFYLKILLKLEVLHIIGTGIRERSKVATTFLTKN